MLNNLKKKRKGFTLIELIIVIAIIAVISAIAIPKLLNSKDDANKKADIANAKTIANAAAVELTNDKLDLDEGSSVVEVAPEATDTDEDGTISAAELEAAADAITNGNLVAAGLQSIPTPKTVTGGSFQIVIGSDSSIKVNIISGTGDDTKTTEAYPDTTELN